MQQLVRYVPLVDLFLLSEAPKISSCIWFQFNGRWGRKGRREADDHNKKAVAEVTRVWQAGRYNLQVE